MAEEQTPNDSGDAGAEQQFAIQKIYIKDVSFESPLAPKLFTEQFNPQVGLELNTNAQSLSDGMYEVVLSLTVTVKQNDNTAYLVEVQQCGIFTLQGFSDADMGGMLGSFCPNILFPYAREAISDIVTRGGFPQLLLAPVNFDALYTQHLAQQQQSGETEATEEATQH